MGSISEFSRDKLERLLRLEKRRRGAGKNRLVFVGMANVADYYWCAMRAVLRSRAEESTFFSAYLEDRIRYSQHLGLIDKLPKKETALLGVGNEITHRDVEKLLKENAKRNTHGPLEILADEATDKDGNRVMIINPETPSEFRNQYERDARARGIRIADPEEFPKVRGEFLHGSRAEEYPTIRWNFDWEGYVVVGVPDGITKTFVYEFKTTRAKFFKFFLMPVATTQADLYGYFFRRDRKRVQIFCLEDVTTETLEEKVDRDRAIGVLKYFSAVDAGEVPIPPKAWKCKSCDLKGACSFVQTDDSQSQNGG